MRGLSSLCIVLYPFIPNWVLKNCLHFWTDLSLANDNTLINQRESIHLKFHKNSRTSYPSFFFLHAWASIVRVCFMSNRLLKDCHHFCTDLSFLNDKKTSQSKSSQITQKIPTTFSSFFPLQTGIFFVLFPFIPIWLLKHCLHFWIDLSLPNDNNEQLKEYSHLKFDKKLWTRYPSFLFPLHAWNFIILFFLY